MARSRASDSETEAKQVVEVLDSSDEENVSVSNNSPLMPSSVVGSPPAQPPPKFWIELPPLPKDHQEYRLIKVPRLPRHLPRPEQSTDAGEERSETALSLDTSNDALIPEKIVGEHSQGGKDYYYARVETGVIYRLTAHSVKSKYPKLVKEYERKKKSGTLSDFDPASTSVHPNHRLKRRPELPRQPRKSTRAKSSRTSSAAYGSGSEVVSVSSDSDSEAVPVRQSSRIAASNKDDKPVSRKLRNLNRNNNAGSSSEFEDKADTGSDYTVSSGADSNKKRIPPIHIKRTRRPRQTVQGLGVVRPFTETVDSDGENEEAVLLRHRQYCEACGQPPAFDQLEKLKRRKGKNKPRKRKRDSDDDESSQPEDERLEGLGGWIRCLRCCIVGHWGCLSAAQRHEILLTTKRHENEVAKAEKRAEGTEVADDAELVDKRKQIWLDEATAFICGQCSKGGRCIVCKEETVPRPTSAPGEGSSATNAIDLDSPSPEKANATESALEPPKETSDSPSRPSLLESAKPGEVHTRYVPLGAPQILFRCITCRRPAHWPHLPPRNPKDKHQITASQIAHAYLEPGPEQWKCHECVRLKYPVESILGWRPDPPEAVETLAPGRIPKPKDMLPREYLVKFKERGFKRVQWVPHMWTLAMHEGLLRHFLKDGTKLPLLEDDSEEYLDRVRKPEQVDDKGKGKVVTGGTLDVLPVFARPRSISAEEDAKPKPEYDETPGPMPDAEQRIPSAWIRIDRVLDIRLRRPKPKKGTKLILNKKKRKATIVVDSEDEDQIESESDQVLYGDDEFVDGEEPPSNLTETVADFELREGRMPTVKELLARAVWVYFKFEDLQYDECAWDSPPRKKDLEWQSYKHALSRYLFAQSVQVLKLTKEEQKQRDSRAHRDLSYWSGTDLQPKLEDKSLKLMPFQVQGLQWLYGNWNNLQPSILADDMGLGKTVQLACLVGRLVTENVYPHLIVVPNSTIVNWIREFERWAPHVRVVRFNGEAKARQVIKKYELWNSDGRQMYHALVTTYETLAGAEFHTVFKKPGRWETVVVDEGQRLKNDSSLLFRKLNELYTVHRILMTGTPLNNNIRELFNLMNFLDPQNWKNLDELEKEYDQENLTEELIARLHERLRPYFLRRQKAEVLDLPVKHEVIVPVSLAPIQKDIMRAILESNIQSLGLLADKAQQNRKGSAPKKTALHNALMEMRKCIQHPYLNQPDMERRGLSQEETLKQLVDASAKFRLLKIMLPQLKKRGHRVLLFSQFKIVLDIIEDFLNMEGYKLLRLDGDTKSSLRQKEIDEFNKPGSDYFIYILTTRAGGVGVNLWSADTVIVFDPDFNPHQDLQAIARAHRYGQKNRVMVFKLMGKNTPEEKIFMMGKKKLVLDHLIVQKLGDEDEMEDIQGILMFGAKALFENPGESASDIKYTEKDVEELIIRAETEKIEEKKSESSGMKFDFAQVWNRQGNTEVGEDNQDAGADEDFWAGVIKRAAEEKEKKRAQVLMGRGARKRAIANYREGDAEDSPERKSNGQGSKAGQDEGEDHEFNPGGEDEESSSESETGSGQPPSSEDYPLVLDGNLTVPFVGDNYAAPHGYLPTVGHPASLGIGPNVLINANPGLSGAINPPKIRRPKKAKKPGLAVPQSGLGNGASRGISANALYFCPHCQRRHGTGGCHASELIDNLLQTHQDILSPDNEDEPDHKYWALKHIEKKLKDEGFDVSQIVKFDLNPVSPPKSIPIPNPKPKPKKPRAPLPQNVGGPVGNTAGPSMSNVKVPKKRKPAPAPGPSFATMAPGHFVPGALPGAPTQPYGEPAYYNYGHVSAPPPFTAPKPVATFASSTADAFNAAARAAHTGQIPGHRAAPRPSHPVTNSSGRIAIPGSSSSFVPPPLQHPNIPTVPSTSSVATAKRPAGSPPEETRKKQKYSACVICDQKPGHPVHECPNIKTPEGLDNAIKKLEGPGLDMTPVLIVLRRMLDRRVKPTQAT
ncbi:chromatin remodeling factor mit1, putative [Rhizoctonia solani AG-3 Rhs1AP]|uniref:Chromatin remodeling factor mit1, putative n=1 Tax=Rhizoctonia solani AG-3 Rhs1AP TaxID=1086054 RepID=X8JS85_9AGAM|nr:chromatin remodeling factor mit1, putative [Rhizoctonia solani AG-3 Rhs1AP]